MNKIKAIIFDFDGVILDTETYEFHALRAIFQEHGTDLEMSDWLPNVGKSHDQFDIYGLLSERSGKQVTRAKIRPRLLAIMQEMLEDVPPLPGVEEYLTTAKRLGMGIGLASNSNQDWIFPKLDHIGLTEFFDTIVCRDDVNAAKPDPALYLTAMANLGVTSEQAFAVEDSTLGVQAAKNADLYCIAVPRPMAKDLCYDHADMSLESLADLPLEQFLAGLQTP